MTSTITLTDEQRAVVDYPESLVVIARPGSGKTFVMAEKIRSTLSSLPPYRGIIAISYTNKASNELKRKVLHDNIDTKRSFFGTIDHFCFSEIIIPFLPHLWGRPPNIDIYQINNLSESEKVKFSTIKGGNVSIEVLEEHIDAIRSCFERGVLLLEMSGALALYLIRRSLACRNYLRARYSHVFFDEYQDSGLEQHEIFMQLHNLELVAIAVGDADQAIFGFSGKESKYLIDLAGRREFKTFPITYNHRCHPSIVNYSLRLLDANSEITNIDARHVYGVCVEGATREVTIWINRNINGICEYFNVLKSSDIGVLVASNRTGEIVDNAFPCKHRFFRSLPLEEHPGPWGRLFARLLRYHFDHRFTAQEIIDEFGTPTLSGREIRRCRKLIKVLNRADLPSVNELKAVARRLLPNAGSEDSIKLLTETLKTKELLNTFIPPADDEIQLMTLHKAKGMEFDLVFHLDLYEWVLPRKGPGPGNDFDNCEYRDWEQDLNCHYVGITRARKCCILCTSTRRINSRNESRTGNPSEFFRLPGLRDLRGELEDAERRGVNPRTRNKLRVTLGRGANSI